MTVVGGKITGLIRAKNLVSQHGGEDVKFISSCFPTLRMVLGLACRQVTKCRNYKLDPVEEILMEYFNQIPPAKDSPPPSFFSTLSLLKMYSKCEISQKESHFNLHSYSASQVNLMQ